MYPQGGRGGSGHSSPYHHQQQQPGRGRAAGHGSTSQPVPQREDDEVPLEALEAGVSPIGGVYYAATPTSLRIPEVQQPQPTPSPSSGSPTGGRRPSPSRVRKPVFGVKGAYSSMAARRYAAALAASGHADPDVLAEAIQAAAAEAEGSRASQLAPAAAAAAGAGGAGTSRATGAPLRGFGSGPIMPSSTAAVGSSAAGAMAGQSRQVAGLVSPRLVGSATGELITQQHQQETAAGAPSEGMRAFGGQEMSPKTPAAASGAQGSALSPLGSSTERTAAAAGTPQVLQQEQAAQVQGVPVAQGVMGTQMRARGSGSGQETEIRTEAHPHQQQQQQAPVPLAATQGFQSFRINPSVTSSMSPDASRSPSPPYRGRVGLPSGVTAAAAAAAAAVAAGGIAAAAASPGERSSGRRSPGRLSPARSASPARPSGVASSPQDRHSQGPTLITLEGTTGSVTGTDASGSLLAAQQRLQEPPEAATIPTSALAGAAAFGGLTVAATAAAGSSSRPVDLASGQNSSTSSSPLSQNWARLPALTPGAQQPDAGASGKSTPFMTPLGSRSSSFGPQADSQERHRLAEEQTEQQQQQQPALQQQGSQGGLLGSLWARFSRSTSKGDDVSGTSASAGGAATSLPVPHQQQQSPQRPAGWTAAAGAGAAAAAAAAAAAGAYAVSGRQGGGDTAGPSSGHYSLDHATGLVSSSSPSRGPGLRPEGDQVASLGGSMAGSPGRQSLQTTPTYLEPLDEMGRPAAAAYTTGQSSPPGGMGHGTAPGGHAVFAPGAVHGPGAAAYSYSPAVGPGSANGSGSALGFVAAGGMLAAGAGAAAAAAGVAALASPGTIPAAIPGRFRQITVPDSDVSSMMSYASSVGEPLQPQRLPPATWPAEALPSPTGSGSTQSAHFAPDDVQQQGDVGGAHPTAQPSRPELEASDGGAGGAGTAAAAAAAAGVAALAAGAAAGGLAGSKRGQQQAAEEQPQVRIKLDAAAAASGSGSSSPRRRSRVGKGAAAAAAGQEVTEQQQVDQEEARKSTAGARRKSGLGGLFGVSAYEAKRSKQSPAPGAKDPTPPADAAAAADKAAAKERKRAAAGTSRTRSKKQRAMCIVIPLVILAILGGIGAAIGITMGQQRSAVASKSRAAQAPAAAGAPVAPMTLQPLSFKVNVTLPPDPSGAPAPSCSELFSPKADRGKLEEYLSTFRQAYAKALDLQPSDIKVGSLACDGRPVKAPPPPPAAAAAPGPSKAPAPRPAAAGSSAAAAPTPTFTPTFAAPAPPTEERPTQMAPVTWAPAVTPPPPARRRSMLEAQHSAAGHGRQLAAVKQAAKAKPAVLTTDFTIRAPTDATERADLAATVMEMSPAILEAPMTQFFGRPVKVAPAVEQPPRAPAQAAPAVPPPAPRAPAKAPVRSPAPKKRPVQASPSPAPARAPVRPRPPPAEDAVPEETPVEAPPTPLLEPPKGSPAPALPPVPSFPQKPTGTEPRRSPRPAPTAAPKPSPVPAMAPPPPPPQGSWPSLLPVFRPQQPQPEAPPRPRWPFGRPPVPQPQPPATATSGPEEATPVLVIPAQPPAPPPGGYPAPPSPSETFSWPAAPSCRGKPNGHTSTPDAEGRLWGFQEGRSCAFRTPNDQPITITWDNAVSCTNKPTTSNSVFDGESRLWGFQNGKSCAYRGNAVQSPPAPGQVVITWDAAPSCAGTPDARNSVRNPQGQLWGYENGKSCAFRIQNGASKVTWVTAPVCKGKPNHYTAVRDDLGRLWGWEANTSCRFSAAS